MSKLRRGLCGLILLVGSVPAAPAAEMLLSKRHVIILQGGTDMIWGTYIFSVDNLSATPAAGRFAILFPQETRDWRVQEGVTAEDVKLDTDGGVVLEKTFAPGSNLVGLAFNAAGESGKATLTFKAKAPLTELLVMAPQGELTIAAPAMEFKADVPFSSQKFNTVSAKNVEAGGEYVVEITNLPEGRGKYQLMALIVLALLIITAAILGYVTRPKQGELDAQWV